MLFYPSFCLSEQMLLPIFLDDLRSTVINTSRFEKSHILNLMQNLCIWSTYINISFYRWGIHFSYCQITNCFSFIRFSLFGWTLKSIHCIYSAHNINLQEVNVSLCTLVVRKTNVSKLNLYIVLFWFVITVKEKWIIGIEEFLYGDILF